MFQKSLAKRSREPFRLLRRMTSELGRMSDVLFAMCRWQNAAEIWAPKVDVVTKDNTLITRVDWPGMTKDDVLVHVDDGQLVLSGERKKELKEDKDVNREERDFDSFRGYIQGQVEAIRLLRIVEGGGGSMEELVGQCLTQRL